MSDAAARDLLADRPDLESAVRAALRTDEEASGAWTFDDVPVDSGAFGELVSAGVVVERDGGYRVADPEATRRALAGEVESGDDAAIDVNVDVAVNRRVAAALGGALLVLFAFRLVGATTVFRPEALVLPGNDPYYYHEVVERAVANGLNEGISSTNAGEPLLVATLWALAIALGGTSAVGGVLTWYPVVSATVTGLLVYALAVVVTDDRRVGVTSVLLLAVTPAHALRTFVGFADHHAFDYPFLVLTALALAVLSTRDARDGRAWLAAAGLGVGVAGQVLAWEAGPLLVLPVGVVIAGRVVQHVAAGRSPASEAVPALAGLAVGAVVVAAVHLALGWHSAVVAFAPAALVAGAVAAVALGEGFARADLPARWLAAVLAVGGVAAALSVRFVPAAWERLIKGIGFLTAERQIAETVSLVGSSWGWLLLFGFLLVFSLPALAWAGRRAADGDGGWLVVAAYASWTLALALFQVRFAGQLAPFVAVLAALSFVFLAARVDVARPPRPLGSVEGPAIGRPDARQVGVLVVLFGLVAGLAVVQVPVKMGQVTIDEPEYHAATHLDDAAEGEPYPAESYVLSRWDQSRMYNHFANGNSLSYGFARNNYEPFVTATDPSGWYDRLADRVGYVVLEPFPALNDSTMQSRLARHHGSRFGSTAGLAHYRTVYVTPDGSHTVVELVPGATVRGEAEANETLTVTTRVDLDHGSFTYTRRVETDAQGWYAVTVPYAGTYEVGSTTVGVPATAVEEGRTVDAGGDATG